MNFHTLELLSKIEFNQWLAIIGWVHLFLITVAALHIILTKEPVQAALGWLALVFFSPIIGSILYFCFGINRIKRVATANRLLTHGANLASTYLAERQLSPLEEQWKQMFSLSQHIHPGKPSLMLWLRQSEEE